MGEGLEHVSREETRMASKPMGRCSTSKVIQEGQKEAATEGHVTPTETAMIRNAGDKWWWGCGAPGALVHSWAMEDGAALQKANPTIQ